MTKPMTEEEKRELLRNYEREANEATLGALRARAETLATVVRNISRDAASCPNEAVKAVYCEIAADYSKKLRYCTNDINYYYYEERSINA